ncbi:hypothetical protein NC653_019133 [Populus alba x Populus x berolinensis]|uniref:Uncharacterized protein n=1 Tax=Populus alba x Populus x berolinensis TaxID=444605 RepID=A0AAD6VWR6_9ROSI|nr:hypothetical protein NC653_019133 [Populus alba x Populus x berolinensis]
MESIYNAVGSYVMKHGRVIACREVSCGFNDVADEKKDHQNELHPRGYPVMVLLVEIINRGLYEAAQKEDGWGKNGEVVDKQWNTNFEVQRVLVLLRPPLANFGFIIFLAWISFS